MKLTIKTNTDNNKNNIKPIAEPIRTSPRSITNLWIYLYKWRNSIYIEHFNQIKIDVIVSNSM